MTALPICAFSVFLATRAKESLVNNKSNYFIPNFIYFILTIQQDRCLQHSFLADVSVL